MTIRQKKEGIVSELLLITTLEWTIKDNQVEGKYLGVVLEGLELEEHAEGLGADLGLHLDAEVEMEQTGLWVLGVVGAHLGGHAAGVHTSESTLRDAEISVELLAAFGGRATLATVGILRPGGVGSAFKITYCDEPVLGLGTEVTGRCCCHEGKEQWSLSSL